MAKLSKEAQRAREELFIATFVENGGNSTRAAIAAGCPPKAAHVQGHRLLTSDKVKRGIARLVKARAKARRMTWEERDALAEEWLLDKALDIFARRGAMQELNRVDGRYSSELRIKGKMTLEQAVEASRAKE